MSQPLVSIIIVTWNTAEITQKCVQTIQKYLPKTFYEIILVDNGSTDNTQKIFKNDKSLIYYNAQKNLGFAKGCNLGAKLANSEILFFLNSDMEFIDNGLIDMVSFYQSQPNIGIVGPKFLNPDGSIQGSVLPPQTPLNAFKQFWLGQKTFTKYSPDSTIPLKVWSVSGGAIMINRYLFNKIGGWNEKYFMYFEDLQICDDVRQQNYIIYFYPLLKLIHRHGASGQHLKDNKNQWKRLIPSSLLYHGFIKHHLINFIIWSGQKISKIF